MPTEFRQYLEQVDRQAELVRVTIIDVQGSAPREAGAVMVVDAGGSMGTIGGGALEYDAIAHARTLLQDDSNDQWRRDVKDYPLGPRLGQCCGGFVKVLFERTMPRWRDFFLCKPSHEKRFLLRPVESGEAPVFLSDERAKLPPDLRRTLSKATGGEARHFLYHDEADGRLWFVEDLQCSPAQIYLYGAGHVGREIVRICAGMDVEIVWVDTDETRFPADLPANATRLIAASPCKASAYASECAYHVVMTYSHAMDLEICHAVLARGAFRFLGLIGSATKRARFEKRLIELGIERVSLERLCCPIGVEGLTGKDPSVIALSVAAQIQMLRDQ